MQSAEKLVNAVFAPQHNLGGRKLPPRNSRTSLNA